MIQGNCRVEQYKGFRFYEQDVLYDDYVFSHDIQVDIDVNYVSPGFGIALMNNEGFSIKEKSSSYLFKVGYREASSYYATKESLSLIRQVTAIDAVTIQENMKLTFIKRGKKVILMLNGKEVFSEYIKKDMDKYNIGIYSNAGNVINSISIASAIPDKWTVNMSNTQGGYVRFYDNTFEIIDCTNDAEIEQSRIALPKGTYYLKYQTEQLDNKKDIAAYVHESDDDRLFDEEKNLLDVNNKFVLKENSEINLKFVGKQGAVYDITVTEDKEDEYISTTETNCVFDGSYVDIFIQDLKKVTWKGIVNRTPGLVSNDIYGLILDNKAIIKPLDAGITLEQEYNYEFDAENYLFKITDATSKIIFSIKLKDLSNKITIFKNISGLISELIIYKKNGETINLNLQDTNKKYINANINGPIIVVDEYGLPLELSSSYRLCLYDKYKKYLFTNYEREYFEPSKRIKLTNRMSRKQDTIVIYGILKDSEIDLSKIYDVPENNINSIDLMCEEYEIIREKDLLSIDKIQNLIYLYPEQINKYKMIIIDYLKENSYCVNYHYDKNAYEVDISTSNKSVKMLYDSNVSNNNKKIVSNVNDYKLTNINGNINGYIVVKKGAV